MDKTTSIATLKFQKPIGYKSINTSSTIIKNECGTTCNENVCFCGKI